MGYWIDYAVMCDYIVLRYIYITDLMEYNRRMKESSLYLTNLPQENICKR
jgi:hypothetical protein